MYSSNQPNSNQFGDDPRDLLARACARNNIVTAPVLGKYDGCVAILDKYLRYRDVRVACLQRLGTLFTNLIESGTRNALEEVGLDRGLEGPHGASRLEAAELVSGLLIAPRASTRDTIFREQIAISCLKEIFTAPLNPSEGAISELQNFLKKAPSFIDRVLKFERSRRRLPENRSLSESDIRFVYRADEIVVSNLRLLIKNNMPADVCVKISDSFMRIERQRTRDEVIDMWKWFAHSSMCSSTVDETRLPEPVGRPALLGAIKGHQFPTKRFDLGGPRVVHHFPLSLPDSLAHWRYFAQRLSALDAIKDANARYIRVSAYVVSFREYFAARRFYTREEQFFREINLHGKGSQDAQSFYSDVYGIDSPPGPDDSPSIEIPLRETAQAFRLMAAARYGLNVRKGYTRTLKDSNKWLLEQMAEELKG